MPASVTILINLDKSNTFYVCEQQQHAFPQHSNTRYERYVVQSTQGRRVPRVCHCPYSAWRWKPEE